MGRVHVQAASEKAKDELQVILDEIDALARLEQDRWANKRASERKRMRTRCQICFIGPNGTAISAIVGSTRDISLGGLGFVSSQHFLRKVPLLVMVTPAGGKTWCLNGKVVYSRQVRDGWYLTGMQFGPGDARMTKEAAENAVAAAQSAAEAAAQRRGRSETPSADGAPSARDRALRAIAAAGAARTLSTEWISKIVMLSKSPDHVVRRATIPVLMRAAERHGHGIMALISLLDDANAQVQREAAEALGELHAIEASERLHALLQHEDQELAMCAAVALGKLGDQGGIHVIARILRTEGPLQRGAARALGLVVGREFGANADGIAAARQYLERMASGSGGARSSSS